MYTSSSPDRTTVFGGSMGPSIDRASSAKIRRSTPVRERPDPARVNAPMLSMTKFSVDDVDVVLAPLVREISDWLIVEIVVWVMEPVFAMDPPAFSVILPVDISAPAPSWNRMSFPEVKLAAPDSELTSAPILRSELPPNVFRETKPGSSVE